MNLEVVAFEVRHSFLYSFYWNAFQIFCRQKLVHCGTSPPQKLAWTYGRPILLFFTTDSTYPVQWLPSRAVWCYHKRRLHIKHPENSTWTQRPVQGSHGQASTISPAWFALLINKLDHKPSQWEFWLHRSWFWLWRVAWKCAGEPLWPSSCESQCEFRCLLGVQVNCSWTCNPVMDFHCAKHPSWGCFESLRNYVFVILSISSRLGVTIFAKPDVLNRLCCLSGCHLAVCTNSKATHYHSQPSRKEFEEWVHICLGE